jgi:hypothetical protein
MENVMKTIASLAYTGKPTEEIPMLSQSARIALEGLRNHIKVARETEPVKVYEIECSAVNVVFVTTNKDLTLDLAALKSNLHLFARFVKLAFDNLELNQLTLTYPKENGQMKGIFITRVQEYAGPKTFVFNLSAAH